MVNVTITSTTRKKGKPDIKEFEAKLYDTEVARFYELTKTKRDLQRMRFDLLPGSKLEDESGTYTCVSVDFLPTVRNKYAILYVK